ncbi:hypothetical protein APED_28545 [Acanthopleuribacter pedis]
MKGVNRKVNAFLRFGTFMVQVPPCQALDWRQAGTRPNPLKRLLRHGETFRGTPEPRSVTGPAPNGSDHFTTDDRKMIDHTKHTAKA